MTTEDRHFCAATARLLIYLALGVGLPGCATTTVSQHTTPATLSDADLGAVYQGLRAALKDVDEPGFEHVRAATSDESGQMFVCGWVSYRMSNGARSSPQAFIGRLSAGKFSVIKIAQDAPERGEVLDQCRGYGASL
jgi:hypothetical protein